MPEQFLKGIGAAAGIASGKVFVYKPVVLRIPQRVTFGQVNEFPRFHAARDEASRELLALKAQVEARSDKEHAAIFSAHSALLYDPMLEDAVSAQVSAGQSIESAVQRATQTLAELLRASGDAHLASRATDVLDVGRRVLRILLGIPDTTLAAMTMPAVLVAQELTPSDTASLNPSLTLGICVAYGGITAHAAILARALRIPAVVGVGDRLLQAAAEAAYIILDGTSGEVVCDPSDATYDRFSVLHEQQKLRTATIEIAAVGLSQTSDGQHVSILANVEDDESARAAVRAGAEGVGLLRTEFLYLNVPHAPSEDEQIAAYARIFGAMEQRPVVVRTLDVGGDKPPQFMRFPPEVNPFLGLRGVRVSLEHPQMFRTQVRAILRAGLGHNVHLLIPMVESLTTLRAVNALIQATRDELDREGVAYAAHVPVGIMVETPSAVLTLDRLLRETDFASLGTNDLTQYTLAADRNHEQVAHYFRQLSPALLRMIQMTVHAARAAHKPLSICGELASYPPAIPILLGLGLESLSMTGSAIPEAKWIIQRFTMAETRQVAAHALMLPTADEIEAYAREELETRGLT